MLKMPKSIFSNEPADFRLNGFWVLLKNIFFVYIFVKEN